MELFGTQSKDFVEGMKEGIRLYAYMNNGVSYVGTTGKKLNEALSEVDFIKGYNEDEPKGDNTQEKKDAIKL